MNPELWQRLEPLYRAALKVPPEVRGRFIAEACGSDQALRQQIEALFHSGHGDTSVEVDASTPEAGEIIPRDTGALTPGDLLLARFRIVSLLGSGGMGDVYEATDLELGRIALKTIRPEIASNAEVLARFKREVQLARKVSGPQVCRIHELFIVNADATSPARVFLTMEFLEGETLSDKLIKSGPLPIDEALKIALNICEGLETIHQAGIIHRDLKSRNIMLATRGGVVSPVLMDFGLAHETTGPAESATAAPDQGRTQDEGVQTGITRVGAIVGTPDYMAPEQFQGREVTEATDVYALGVILYELVTGKQPFAAPTPVEQVMLRGRPFVPPSSLRRQLPRLWDEVIGRCLQYEAHRRYQSAREVAAALEGSTQLTTRLAAIWRKVAPVGLGFAVLLAGTAMVPAVRERLQGILYSSREKHIAVLPIESASGDAQTLALGDGLMDSLSGQLSNLDTADQRLWIIPATEVRAEKVTDPAGALRQFGATIVVKGTVERHAERVHLALTLIDTRKMRQIGYTEIDSPTADIGGMESEAVDRLGRLMNLSLSSSKDRASMANRASYDDYLTAIGYMERYDKPGNLDLAIASLKRALASDDHFALALAQIGEAYRLKYQLDRNPRWLDQALLYCQKAAEIDRGAPAVFITLARVHEATGKHDLAVQEFQRALELDPRNAEAISGLAMSYATAGRVTEAEASYKQAIALRPDYWDGYEELGNFYDNQGKFPLAIDEYHRAIALTPDNAQVYINLGAAYIDWGDSKLFPNAEQALKHSIALSPTYAAYANLGYLYTLERRYSDSASANEKALQLNDHDYRVWGNLLGAYTWLHQDKKADTVRKQMLPLVEEAIRVNPENADAHAELASLYAHDRLQDEAISHVQTAMALAPNDPLVLANIGDAYLSLGDRGHAIESINRAFTKGYTLSDLLGDPDLQRIRADPALHLPAK